MRLDSPTAHWDGEFASMDQLVVGRLNVVFDTEGGAHYGNGTARQGGGAPGVESSIEETGAALSALGLCRDDNDESAVHEAVTRGAAWLVDATGEGTRVPAAPIGLYFARLWYYEDLYPLIFAIEGLAAVRQR